MKSVIQQKKQRRIKMKKNDPHLTWTICLITIISIICITLIYINSNSWTVRFEMDNNTKEAIESIEFDEIGWYSCSQGIGVTCSEKTFDGGTKYPCHSLTEVINYAKKGKEKKENE